MLIGSQVVYIAAAGLHLLELIVSPPARYPDLFPVLNVLVSRWKTSAGILGGYRVLRAISVRTITRVITACLLRVVRSWDVARRSCWTSQELIVVFAATILASRLLSAMCPLVKEHQRIVCLIWRIVRERASEGTLGLTVLFRRRS